MVRRYKRGKVWWLSWTENGKTERESTKCTSAEAAELVRRKRERDNADPAHATKNAATLTDAIKDIRAELGSRRRSDGSPVPEATIEVYECKSGHLARLLPAQLVEINVSTVETYFVTRRDEGASYSTMYKEWVALAATLKGAQRRGVFDAAIPNLKPRWLTPSYVPVETFLPWEHVPRLLAELEPERRGTVAFIFATGARWSEAMRYRTNDLDRTTWVVHVKGTKTKKSNRRFVVPEPFRGLLDHVGDAFQPWANVGRDLEVACRRAQRRLAKEVAKQEPHEGWHTPIFPVVGPNDMRRTFASLLVQGGTPLEDVARMLGHADTTMVYRVYGQDTLESLAKRVTLGVLPVYQTPGSAEETTDIVDGGKSPQISRKPIKQARPVRFELTTSGFEGRSRTQETPIEPPQTGPSVRRVYQTPRLTHLPPGIGAALFAAGAA